jgi:hypothetical protein
LGLLVNATNAKTLIAWIDLQERKWLEERTVAAFFKARS